MILTKFISIIFLSCVACPILITAQSKCIQKTPGIQFAGNMIGLQGKTESADQCATICQTYLATKQKECKSANYIASNKYCQLMEETLNTSDDYKLKLYGKANDDSTYISVVCSDSGKPLPSVVLPTPPPAGKPIPPGSCGRAGFDVKSTNQRIVGGFEARPHSLPWIVSLSRFSGISFCGGTLIRVNPKVDESDIMITAAHCVEDGARTISAIFGAHMTGFKSEKEGTETIEVAKIVIHPKYAIKSLNDIAVLKLSRPVKFGPWIQPACLPASGEMIPDGTSALASGWGRSKEDGSSPDSLYQVNLPVIAPQTCVDAFKKNGWPVAIQPLIHLCAGVPEGGIDTCQGDSGGPLVAKGPNGYVLQGVVSFGKGCARAGWPGIYARVSTFVDWINEQVKQMSTVYASG